MDMDKILDNCSHLVSHLVVIDVSYIAVSFL